MYLLWRWGISRKLCSSFLVLFLNLRRHSTCVLIFIQQRLTLHNLIYPPLPSSIRRWNRFYLLCRSSFDHNYSLFSNEWEQAGSIGSQLRLVNQTIDGAHSLLDDEASLAGITLSSNPQSCLKKLSLIWESFIDDQLDAICRGPVVDSSHTHCFITGDKDAVSILRLHVQLSQ